MSYKSEVIIGICNELNKIGATYSIGGSQTHYFIKSVLNAEHEEILIRELQSLGCFVEEGKLDEEDGPIEPGTYYIRK